MKSTNKNQGSNIYQFGKFEFSKIKTYTLSFILGAMFMSLWDIFKNHDASIFVDGIIQVAILFMSMALIYINSSGNKPSEKEKNAEEQQLFSASLQILNKQVHTSLTNSETAVMHVVERLTHIQSINAALHQEASQALTHTSTITQEMQKLSGESHEALNNFVQKQNLLTQLQSQKDTQVAQAMENINDLIGPLVEVIRNIAQQTQLLSFNAAIEAARAGHEGNGFKIVATAVRELAQQTTEAAKKIEEGIESVQKAALISNVSYSNEIDTALQGMHDMHSVLAANFEQSNVLFPFLQQLSQSMDQGTAEIRDHVVDALGQMQFQDILRQLLEHVEQGLDALANYSSTSTADERTDLALLLQQWKESYVSLEQRLAHENTLSHPSSSQPVNEGPKIELF